MVYNDVQTLQPTQQKPICLASSIPSTCPMLFHACSNESFVHLVGDGEVRYRCAMGGGKRVYIKAQFLNVQQYQEKFICAGGILYKHTIRNALAKCQPKQRTWGLQGAVPLGMRVVANSTQQGRYSISSGHSRNLRPLCRSRGAHTSCRSGFWAQELSEI